MFWIPAIFYNPLYTSSVYTQSCSSFSNTHAQAHLHSPPCVFSMYRTQTQQLLNIHTYTHHVPYQTHTQTHKCSTDSPGEAPVWNTEPMLLTWKSLHSLRCDISPFRLLLFPYSLPLSYPLSSAEPIFWHFRRCSSHACHLSPSPPTLSSELSIESTRLCLKLMYFVELTLWCLHHLEVGKWYWVERLIFSV